MRQKTIVNVGLDVGSYSVKCVEVTQVKNKPPKISKVSHQVLSGSVMSNLKEIFQGESVLSKRIRIAVAGPSVLIRRLELPLMNPLELKAAIRFEAEKHIPFPIDDCVLDSQILSQDEAKKIMKVLLVAAKKDFINEKLKTLTEAAGLEPELIDVDIFCALNTFQKFAGLEAPKTFGMLNIGHEITSLCVVQNDQPFLVRQISRGGAEVSKALAQTKGISEFDANRLKEAHAAESSTELIEATRGGFEALVDEIHQSIDYFENEAGEPLESLWIGGGGALAEGAVDFFASELGKKVHLWEALNKAEIQDEATRAPFEKNACQFNVALGMAFR